MEKEVWKPVEGFEGYEVSNMGQVRSTKRKNPILMTPVKRSDKDRRTYLMLRKNKKSHSWLVSRLVAEAFVPNPEGYRVVDFKDGDVTNNRADNLRWISFSEKNNASRRKNGTAKVEVECSTEGCDKIATALGMCKSHYYAYYRANHFGNAVPGKYKREIVAYVGAHERVRRAKGFPKNYPCARCGGQSREWALSVDAETIYVATNGRYKGYRYSLNIDDYLPMCGKCHAAYDAENREAFARKSVEEVPVFQSAPSEQALKIVELLKTKRSLKDVANEVKTSPSHICRVFYEVTGEHWSKYKKAMESAA